MTADRSAQRSGRLLQRSPCGQQPLLLRWPFGRALVDGLAQQVQGQVFDQLTQPLDLDLDVLHPFLDRHRVSVACVSGDGATDRRR